MDQRQLLFQAAVSRFTAKRDEARAILTTYLMSSVGVAEHSGLLDEIEQWTKTLAESEECLAALEKAFITSAPTEQNNEG